MVGAVEAVRVVGEVEVFGAQAQSLLVTASLMRTSMYEANLCLAPATLQLPPHSVHIVLQCMTIHCVPPTYLVFHKLVGFLCLGDSAPYDRMVQQWL